MELGFVALIVVLAAMILFAFKQRDQSTFGKSTLHQSYLIGLNFLLNEQPDKAVDIFIDILEVNKDTVETHLAMGNHFRKSGEGDKAIRIHQNLVTHTHLPKRIRVEALSALGEDYLKAGVLDRAERIFQEVITLEPGAHAALKYLLEIYQQEKSWHEAIDIAEKLLTFLGDKNTDVSQYKKIIAQYNCEIADNYFYVEDLENAELFLKRALKSDLQCLRAYFIETKIHLYALRCSQAIESLKIIGDIQASFLFYCVHELLGMKKNPAIETCLVQCIDYCVNKMSPEALLLLLNVFPNTQLSIENTKKLMQFIYQQPSLLSLTVFYKLKEKSVLTAEDESFIQASLKGVSESLSSYLCDHCGYRGKRFSWQCPSCKNWGEIRPYFSK